MKVNIKDILMKYHFYVVMIFAIIAGAILVGIRGFEYSIENADHERLEVILNAPYDEKEMDDLVDSALNDDYIVRTSSLFGTIVAIDSKDFTDEEITSILNKINEKYGTDYSLKNLKLSEIIEKYELSDVESMKEDKLKETIEKIKTEYNLEYTKDELADTESIKVDLNKIKGINILDTVKKFVVPVIVSIIAIIAYIGIRAAKYDKLASIKALGKLVITEMFIVAVVAIIKLPVDNSLVTGLVAIGILELVIMNIQNEKRIAKESVQKRKKKKK